MLPSPAWCRRPAPRLAAVTVMPMRPGRVPSLSRAKPSMICVPLSGPAGAPAVPLASRPGRAWPRRSCPFAPAWPARPPPSQYRPRPAVPTHPRLRVATRRPPRRRGSLGRLALPRPRWIPARAAPRPAPPRAPRRPAPRPAPPHVGAHETGATHVTRVAYTRFGRRYGRCPVRGDHYLVT